MSKNHIQEVIFLRSFILKMQKCVQMENILAGEHLLQIKIHAVIKKKGLMLVLSPTTLILLTILSCTCSKSKYWKMKLSFVLLLLCALEI